MRAFGRSSRVLTQALAARAGPVSKGWARPVAASAAGAVFGVAAHSTTAFMDPVVTFESLQAQDSKTSGDVIKTFNTTASFVQVARVETTNIMARDQQDDVELGKGIKIAIDKGVIPAKVVVEPISKIDVMGKSADSVAGEIIAKLGPAATTGCVMTLEGLSGTGKGTTVARLKVLLPNAVTWSNGNIFRSMTLLAVTYSEKHGVPLEKALTPENLADFSKMITFGKYNGKFDVLIEGLGHKALVSEIQNTTLKGPKVGKNIPQVAGQTQGEVINFVKGALTQMTADGVSVLLEGRAQTLNYIRTPHRFELVLSDDQLIGKRRAAQRMMAEAGKQLGTKKCSEAEVQSALQTALATIAKE